MYQNGSGRCDDMTIEEQQQQQYMSGGPILMGNPTYNIPLQILVKNFLYQLILKFVYSILYPSLYNRDSAAPWATMVNVAS